MSRNMTEVEGWLLVYSEDDGAWYWQKPGGDWETSQLFMTRLEAVEARKAGKVEFR